MMAEMKHGIVEANGIRMHYVEQWHGTAGGHVSRLS